jgi:cytosine/adenosine deaminase-related metal-dependent hydrolase
MPDDVIDLGTRGGAACLGRDDIGRLEVGAAADIAVWPGDDLGDMADPHTALVMGPDRRVRHLFVAGEQRVADGEVVGVDMTAAHRRLAERARRLWA